MTLLATTSRSVQVASAGALTIPVPFKVQRAVDLIVYKTPSGGSATLLTHGTHYSIDGLGDETCNLLLVTAADAGDAFLTYRVVAIAQDTSFRNQGAYLPQTQELTFDRLVMMHQQVEAILSSLDPSLARALLLGVADTIGEGAYDALSNRISNVEDPTEDRDAATKGYVDSAVGGIASQGGGSFISVTVASSAALPTAGVTYDGLVYRVRNTVSSLPDILQVCLRQSDGVTYEWVVLASASA